jgi:uncharacterized protein YecE (DUF72 family)
MALGRTDHVPWTGWRRPHYEINMTAPLWIGTAGWTVPSRYAAQLPSGGSHLERYARCLNAAEINSSFYRSHRRQTYDRWASCTPANFRFAVKVPKAMTHERRLVDCGDLLDRFIAEIAGLGDKLGVLLVQLPPKAEFGEQAAEQFFRDLRARTAVPAVLEPRHISWFSAATDEWLTERRIARVAADPARVPGARDPGGWRGLSYYRWHGSPRIYFSPYDAVALTSLREHADHDRARGIATWCIFDNTGSGAALGNALTLAASVSN